MSKMGWPASRPLRHGILANMDKAGLHEDGNVCMSAVPSTLSNPTLVTLNIGRVGLPEAALAIESLAYELTNARAIREKGIYLGCDE